MIFLVFVLVKLLFIAGFRHEKTVHLLSCNMTPPLHIIFLLL